MNQTLITDENFYLFAAHYYNNKQCISKEEFDLDLKRIKYLRKIFTRYKKTKDLKERIVLNHLILLFNVFDLEACIKMLFLKLEGQWSELKPFLVLLSVLPEKIYNVGDHKVIITSSIPLDNYIVDKLRKI